jgi:hypothetical protein
MTICYERCLIWVFDIDGHSIPKCGNARKICPHHDGKCIAIEENGRRNER